MTDGTVSAVAPSGGTLYIGGSFSQVGPRTGPFASVSGSSGTLNSLAAQLAGTVYATAPDGSGGYFVGGAFSVPGSTIANAAHIKSDGTLDTSWTPNPTGTVYALAVSGSTVYLGGVFDTITNSTGTGTIARTNAAAVDNVNGRDAGWAPDPGSGGIVTSRRLLSPSGIGVYALAVSGTTVYLGGNFSAVRNQVGTGFATRDNAAAVDKTTGDDTGWNPSPDAPVDALAVAGSTVYLGGSFSSIAATGTTTVTRDNAAAVDTTNGFDTGWNPSPNGTVNAIAVSGADVYLGGSFSSITDITGLTTVTRDNAAAVDALLGHDTGWNPEPDGTVNALAVSGTTVYLGGSFHSITDAAGTGRATRNFAGAVDSLLGHATSWDANPNAAVNALAVSGPNVYLGGGFTSVNGQARSNAAALDSGGALTSWNPSPNGQVHAITVAGSTIYLGGGFSSVGGQSRSNAAAVDTSGSVTSWNPAPDSTVLALASSGSTIYLGGSFGTVAGQPRSNAAALDTSGSLTSWNPTPNGSINALALAGSTVFLGGSFSSVAGGSRSNAAAFDASGTIDAWAPNPNGAVNALAIDGPTVYLGGGFSVVRNATGSGIVARANAAGVDSTQGRDTGWNPSPNGQVMALAASGSTILMGGAFGSITNGNGSGRSTRSLAAAVDPTHGYDDGWNPSPNGQPVALSFSGQTVYAGGAFTSFGGYPQSGIAELADPQQTLTVTPAGSGSGSASSSPFGISCGPSCSASFDRGANVVLTATPAAGSRFAGWSGGGCSGTGTCTVTLSADTAVTATFTAQNLLTVTDAGSGAGDVTSNPVSINCGLICSQPFDTGTSVTLTATPAAGSRFAGWSGGGCSGAGTCIVALNADTAVTATFIAQPVLTAVKSGAGAGTVSSDVGAIVCGASCSQAYDLGTTVTLSAAAAPGSTFTGWSGGGCGGTGQCVLILSTNTIVVANFVRPLTLTVSPAGTGLGTVTSSPAGINCGATCSLAFTSGTPVTLIASPSPGSRFAGWSGAGCSGTGGCTVPMSSAASVTASFIAQRTLTTSKAGAGAGTITSDVGGVNCGGSCSGIYDQGTRVTLTARPSPGSTFASWSGGGCAGSAGCTIVLNGATTVTATFAKIPAPSCTLRVASSNIRLKAPKKAPRKGKRVSVGTLASSVRCKSNAQVSLTGLITEPIGKKPKHGKQRTKTFRLGPVRSSLRPGVPATLTLKLPKGALSDLGHKAKMSVKLTLSVKGAGGAGTAKATIKSLKGV